MTIDYRAEAGQKREDLLVKIKKQYEPGTMRPRLCQETAYDDVPLPELRLQWEYYAGMGDTALMDLTPEDEVAARELMEQGYIVPTFESATSPYDKIRLLDHFDDVRWGRKENGSVVIYRLSLDAQQWPDMIIEPDDTHAPAVQELEKRIAHNRDMKYHPDGQDTPLLLNENIKVIPLVTEREALRVMTRQAAYLKAYPAP